MVAFRLRREGGRAKPFSSNGEFEKKKNGALNQLLDWFDLASRRVGRAFG